MPLHQQAHSTGSCTCQVSCSHDMRGQRCRLLGEAPAPANREDRTGDQEHDGADRDCRQGSMAPSQVHDALGPVVARGSEVGVGTTFKILLPATAAVSAGRAHGDAPAAARGTETVLLVEDEDGVRQLGRLVLEAHGYTVLEAASGAEAVALAARHAGHIHIMVTDVVMPEMNGREAAEVIRARRPGRYSPRGSWSKRRAGNHR